MKITVIILQTLLTLPLCLAAAPTGPAGEQLDALSRDGATPKTAEPLPSPAAPGAAEGGTCRFGPGLFGLPAPHGADHGTKAAGKAPAALKYAPECVLKAVAEMMGQKYRPDIPLPKIFFESSVPLKQFQDAVEPQWGMRPAQVTNVYAWNRNEIYLMDDAAWYAAHKRAIDDSLAHELVHYIQHRYRGWDLSEDDPSYEPQAVEFQTLFREEYINKPGACPR